MIQNVLVKFLCTLPGASANLSQKTVIARVSVSGDLKTWRDQCIQDSTSISTAVAQLLPMQTAFVKTSNESIRQIETSPEPATAFAQAVMTLCIGLQRESRDAVWLGEILQIKQINSDWVITLALPYERESVLKDALQWALRCWVLWGKPGGDTAQYNELINACRHWLDRLQQTAAVPPNTLRFALAAYARDWPVNIEESLLHIGWGKNRLTFDSSFTGRTSLLASRTARNKHKTSRLLHQAKLPVPSSALVANWDSALEHARKLGWPVVVKPSNQDQGTAVVPDIRDEDSLRTAFDHAARYSPGAVLVEKHVHGDDHRLLVVHGRLLAATRRLPGSVTGDGRHTVAQLIAQVNTNSLRGSGKRSLLIKLTLDDEARDCLREQSLVPDSVPREGQHVRLRRTANISTGGTAEDVTTLIHPDNRALAERAARVIGLDIAGVDFLCPDISRSWLEVGGAICEVNAQPGFRPHWISDPARDINGEILDILFEQRSPRIPTAAITGADEQTIVCRMLHHIWQSTGTTTGVCTTQGVWVGRDHISRDNLSGLPGARLLFADPSVEAAVLEIPCEDLIRFGHPCDRYDVAVLLNTQGNHIDADGQQRLKQMTELKADVLQRARSAVVISADDPLNITISNRSRKKRHVMVAREADNTAVSAHAQTGGEVVFAAIHDDGQPWIILAVGTNEMPLMPLHDIPATMNGQLKFNEQNALFAVAAAWAQGLSLGSIRQAMASLSLY